MYKPWTKINGWPSILLGLLIFVFYYFYYPYHLHYQEQFQLFLNRSEYLSEQAGKPGGLSEYIAGYFIQFFSYRWYGALTMGVLLGLMSSLIAITALGFGRKKAFELLACIPPVLYWSLFCDENYMLAGLIALLLSLLPLPLYQKIKSYPLRISYLLVMLPALYWFAGGMFMVFGTIVIAWEFLKTEDTTLKKWSVLFISCLLFIGLPFLAKLVVVQYPIERLVSGVTFYRYPQYPVWPVVVIALSTVIIPVLFFFIPDYEKKQRVFAVIFQLAIIISGSGYLISMMVNKEKEEVMTYDYHVRMRNWDKIIEMADKKAPSSSLSVSCLNLALCKKGIMGDRMFHYYQNGLAGLFPSFARDYTIPFIAGEIYYHLGFVNTAQRYAFEAMEALPDYQKSVRAIKRLAETNIINGEYNVARKYLKLLQKTTLYKHWADKTMLYLSDEAKIEADPEWGTLRKYRTKVDFLFSEPEKDMMLGILLQQNPTHRMAFEYLMAYCLLTKDLKHFHSYYPLGKEINYKSIPLHYQEALIYIWGLNHEDPTKNIPYPINDKIKNDVRTYGNIYTSQQNPEPMLRKQFSGTFWYYLHFRKHNKATYEELYDVYADNTSPVSPGV